jgi:periplasmic protein CpxP/Spy
MVAGPAPLFTLLNTPFTDLNGPAAAGGVQPSVNGADATATAQGREIRGEGSTMKTKFVASLGLAGALMVGSLGMAAAQVPAAGDTGDQAAQTPRHGKGGHHGGRFGKRGAHRGGGFFGAELGITDEQRAQIRAIMEAERTKNATLHQQLADNHRAMREATKAGRFDEAQIRTLAQQRAALQTEMTVARARIQSSIFNTVLTAEQKSKLEQLEAERATKRAERKERRGERRNGQN